MGTARSRSAVAIILGSILWVACGAPKPPAPKAETAAEELVITPKAMAGFINAYFTLKSKGGDGFMKVHDATTNTAVQLKLKPMETAEVIPLGMGIFNTCVPMEDAAGGVWDVDFTSQRTDRGVDFIETGVHKTPTETHYEWRKNAREVWEKQPS